MSNTLNIDEIEQNVSGQLEVVEKTKELQKIVSRVFPGYRVKITSDADLLFPQGSFELRSKFVPPQADFSSLTGIEQIERVLKDNGEAMKLRDLHDKLIEAGGSMSLSTLMSLLSKYQKQDKFRRFGHALWGLPTQITTGPDE